MHNLPLWRRTVVNKSFLCNKNVTAWCFFLLACVYHVIPATSKSAAIKHVRDEIVTGNICQNWVLTINKPTYTYNNAQFNGLVETLNGDGSWPFWKLKTWIIFNNTTQKWDVHPSEIKAKHRLGCHFHKILPIVIVVSDAHQIDSNRHNREDEYQESQWPALAEC